jgi:hypothetical protein
MKTMLTPLALTAALAQPAEAIQFSKLTTIYVASGVLDDGFPDGQGIATSVHCSNVSGVSAQVRALILSVGGVVEGSQTFTLAHGTTHTFSTHDVTAFYDFYLNTGFVSQGVLNVESTNSAVFCTAVVVDASSIMPTFMSPLHLVRINPHPGAVE